MNLKLNRMCPGSRGMGSCRLQPRSRENMQNLRQIEAHAILAVPNHAWSEHSFITENEMYDTVKRQWAAVSTTVKGKK